MREGRTLVTTGSSKLLQKSKTAQGSRWTNSRAAEKTTIFRNEGDKKNQKPGSTLCYSFQTDQTHRHNGCLNTGLPWPLKTQTKILSGPDKKINWERKCRVHYSVYAAIPNAQASTEGSIWDMKTKVKNPCPRAAYHLARGETYIQCSTSVRTIGDVLGCSGWSWCLTCLIKVSVLHSACISLLHGRWNKLFSFTHASAGSIHILGVHISLTHWWVWGLSTWFSTKMVLPGCGCCTYFLEPPVNRRYKIESNFGVKTLAIGAIRKGSMKK